jgi:hypothetical protein
MTFDLKRLLTTALLFTLPAAGQVVGKPFKVSTTDLTQELQKHTRGDGFKLVWWIPNEFWMASSGKPGSMDALIAALDPYTLVAIIDGQMSPLGAITYKPEEEIRKNVQIFDVSGKAYAPLDSNSISGDVSNVISMIKPLLSNAMGEMGKNFVFLVFPKKGKDGKPIANPTGTGRFHVKVGEENFFYRLPLAALSPKLKCKNDSELFPSNYLFCPYHGTSLVPQDAAVAAK